MFHPRRSKHDLLTFAPQPVWSILSGSCRLTSNLEKGRLYWCSPPRESLLFKSRKNVTSSDRHLRSRTRKKFFCRTVYLSISGPRLQNANMKLLLIYFFQLCLRRSPKIASGSGSPIGGRDCHRNAGRLENPL